MVMFVEFVLAAALFLAIVELLLFRGIDIAVSTAPSNEPDRADHRSPAEVVPCS
jgi:hypothetical protein